jgi:hypothetical protein
MEWGRKWVKDKVYRLKNEDYIDITALCFCGATLGDLYFILIIYLKVFSWLTHSMILTKNSLETLVKKTHHNHKSY